MSREALEREIARISPYPTLFSPRHVRFLGPIGSLHLCRFRCPRWARERNGLLRHVRRRFNYRNGRRHFAQRPHRGHPACPPSKPQLPPHRHRCNRLCLRGRPTVESHQTRHFHLRRIRARTLHLSWHPRRTKPRHGLVALIFLGVISGTFGGVLRDLLRMEVPLIFRREIYATAAIIGGFILLGLDALGVASPAAIAIATLSIATIRILAIRYSLNHSTS